MVFGKVKNSHKRFELWIAMKSLGELKNEIKHGLNRQEDIPHSLASVDKAKDKLGYQPTHNFTEGLKEAVKWYWENL